MMPFFSSLIGLAGALVSSGVDPEARFPYWEVRDDSVSIRLVQRLPDQTRGFFQARGFRPAEAEIIAQSCVFQTTFRNISGQSAPVTIEYNLREWIIHHDGRRRGLKTREDWKQQWQAGGIARPAQLAFQWALMPTRQQYRPGDYSWGMSVFNLKPGAQFDLDMVWYRNGRREVARIKAIRCAADVTMEPASP